MSDSVDEGLFPPHAVEPSQLEIGGADADKVVSARGTEDGLVLRIDGGAPWGSVLSELETFLGGRKRFFEGGQVLVEWVERLPSKEQCAQLEEILKVQYGMSVASRKRRSQLESIKSLEAIRGTRAMAERDAKDAQAGVSLVDEIEQIAAGVDSPEEFAAAVMQQGRSSAGALSQSAMHQLLSEDLFTDDDANAKVVFGTVRSGQRVETPFSLVIVGDVNPGADLIAGGDIIVLGSLRGTAHASAYDDDGFDSVIVALHMRPMQLRIGSIISRGSDEDVKLPEIARIENRRIVVETFNSRAAYWRKPS